MSSRSFERKINGGSGPNGPGPGRDPTGDTMPEGRRTMMRTTNLKFLTLALAILLLATACSRAQPTEEVLDTAAGQADFGNVASATGKVVPVRWASMSFETGGQLSWVAEEGQALDAGETVARLEAPALEMAVAQAEAVLASAQAELALAEAGATPAEIAAAEAAVAIAEGDVAAAEGTLQKTQESVGPTVDVAEANLAQAQARLSAARSDLARAVAELERLEAGPRPEEVAAAQFRVNQAQAEFLYYENLHFEQYIDKGIGGGAEERARYQREMARNARDAVQAELDLLLAGASEEELAPARGAVGAARAQVTNAQAAVDAAEAEVRRAQTSDADVTIAEAQVQLAEGRLAQATAELQHLQAGATEEEIAALEARVDQAEAALGEAQAALSRSVLLAPFSGTVGRVHARTGEMITPGQAMLAFGDLSSLHVETTDLNEVDAARVGVDSPVTLTFDAFPELNVDGVVARLAPMASEGQGGTNFTAIIDMESPPEGLRWGMTAFVDIEVD